MSVYEEIYKKCGLSSTQREIIKIVGDNQVVLEIGSSIGYMTKAFLSYNNIVDVVEKDNQAISRLSKKVRVVFNQSIEDKQIFKLLARDYNFVVMADVLEHLVDPEETLKDLLKIVSPQTKLIISVPNIACWAMRKKLFFKGNFEYQKSGLLDKTHLHFYTVNTLPKLLLACGWKVNKIIGTITRFPLEGLIGKVPIINWLFKNLLYQMLVNKYKNLAYYHFLVIATNNEQN